MEKNNNTGPLSRLVSFQVGYNDQSNGLTSMEITRHCSISRDAPDPIFDCASIVEWDSNWDLNAETNAEELFFPHHLMLPHFLPLFVMSLHPGATIPERASHSFLSAHVQTQKIGSISVESGSICGQHNDFVFSPSSS